MAGLHGRRSGQGFRGFAVLSLFLGGFFIASTGELMLEWGKMALSLCAQ